MKLDAAEKEILDLVERGEWRSARTPKRAKSRYSSYAKATFRKDRRLNIRIRPRIWKRSRSVRLRRDFLIRR